jgi:hypothetical protein
MTLLSDWLVKSFGFPTGVYRTGHTNEIAMTNGLIRRTRRLRLNAVTLGFDNRMTGVFNSARYEAGTLDQTGLASRDACRRATRAAGKRGPETQMAGAEATNPQAFCCTELRVGNTKKRLLLKRMRFSRDQPLSARAIRL